MSTYDTLKHAVMEFFETAERIINRVEAGHPAERQKLRGAHERVLRTLEQTRPRYYKANAARSEKASERREQERFSVRWRSTGRLEYVQGWDAMSKRSGLMLSTLRMYLSKGKGRHYMTLLDTETGLGDSVEITRLGYAPGKGRPPKESED